MSFDGHGIWGGWLGPGMTNILKSGNIKA